MRMRLVWLALVVSIGLAPPALAAEACKPVPAAQGAPISFPSPMSEADRLGLSAAALWALNDDTGKGVWPDDELERAAPCPVGEFRAGGADWTVTGGAGRLPPRVIHSAVTQEYVFLALGPSPAEAGAWLAAGGGETQLTVKRPTYYLVHARSGVRMVHQAYDAMPSAAVLEADARGVIEGRHAPLLVFDMEGQAATVLTPTASGVQAQLFAPDDHLASLYGPDGKFFAAAGDQTVRMRGSGFTCPPALGRLARTRLMVVNGTERVLDLGCGFNGTESWLTLFVTRGAALDQANFKARLADAQKAAGVSRELAAATEVPGTGAVWLDKRGTGQGLWLMQRGGYLVEARATFAPQDEAHMRQVVSEVARAAAAIPD